MSPLAALETALRRDRAYGALAQTHAHRTVREDSLGLLKGRDAILAAWVAQDGADIAITADLGDMIAYEVAGWHGHRWVWRAEDRILREVEVEDRGVARSAPPVHPPLGELRSGRGQFDAGDSATSPPDFPPGARALADRLHRAWNGRAFDLYSQPWLTALVRALPDATFHFERAIVQGAQTALLWRVHGHHGTGQRVRLIGSSVFTADSDMTVLDHQALAAQLAQPLIDYGQPEGGS